MDILSKISSFYQKIREIGVTDELSFSEKIRVKLVNLFVLVSLHTLLLHVLYNFLGPNEIRAYLVPFVWTIIIGTTLFLNYRGKYFAAKFLITGISLVATVVLHRLNGWGIRLEPMYLLLIVSSAFFFTRKIAILMSIFVVLSYGGVAVYLSKYPAPWADRIIPTAPIMYFGFAIISIFVLTWSVLQENKKFNLKLKSQNDELTKKNHALERFNFILSHDLRTPVRHLVSFSELLERNIKRGDFTESKENLFFIKNGARRIYALLEDMTLFSNVDKKAESPGKWVDLNLLVDRLSLKLKKEFGSKEIQINTSALPPFFCSPYLFSILLEKIIHNGLIHNEHPTPTVDISHRTEGNFLILDFKDNGVGIEEAYHAYIFDHFRKLPTPKTLNRSGMGLTISQKIVSLYGGEINLYSNPQQGSIFSIRLPIVGCEK